MQTKSVRLSIGCGVNDKLIGYAYAGDAKYRETQSVGLSVNNLVRRYHPPKQIIFRQQLWLQN